MIHQYLMYPVTRRRVGGCLDCSREPARGGVYRPVAIIVFPRGFVGRPARPAPIPSSGLPPLAGRGGHVKRGKPRNRSGKHDTLVSDVSTSGRVRETRLRAAAFQSISSRGMRPGRRGWRWRSPLYRRGTDRLNVASHPTFCSSQPRIGFKHLVSVDNEKILKHYSICTVREN
jgi:hypothetical protein